MTTTLVPPPTKPQSRSATTPQRVQILTAAVAVLALALGLVIARGAADIRDGFKDIRHRAAPQVLAATDLYVALSAMDTLVANVLLIGNDQGAVVTQSAARAMYAQRRNQANTDLRQAAASAAGNPRAQQALGTLLDGLGEYDALTAQAMMLDDNADHAAGKPAANALALYRQATDLMKTRLLPAADELSVAGSDAIDDRYDDIQADVGKATILTALAAIGLLVTLIALQVLLARRFRRRFNPLLLLTTVATIGLLIASVSVFTAENDRGWVTKYDTFDSVLTLARVRTLSYDLNADESRYLLDRNRAEHEKSFLATTQQIVNLPGATLLGYSDLLRYTIASYDKDHGNIQWYGYLGLEFRRISLPGERDLAEEVMQNFMHYLMADQHMRELVQRGEVEDAITFTTPYTGETPRYYFAQYDQSLEQLFRLRWSYFDKSLRAGEHAVDGWDRVPWVIVIALAGLAYVAVRPRLAEYR